MAFEKITCPVCKGEGRTDGTDVTGMVEMTYRCNICCGTGVVDKLMWDEWQDQQARISRLERVVTKACEIRVQMIAIVNITPNPKPFGVHRYSVRINQEEIFQFDHKREDDLATCLSRASMAAERKKWEDIEKILLTESK